MKKIVLLLALSAVTCSTAFSQANNKVIVMVTRANWCPPCRANEGKIKNELIPSYAASKDVLVVINDVTNKRTKAKSKPGLKSAGVYEIAQKELSTGVIAIINQFTGKVIRRLHVGYSFEKMKMVIDEAVSKLSDEIIGFTR